MEIYFYILAILFPGLAVYDTLYLLIKGVHSRFILLSQFGGIVYVVIFPAIYLYLTPTENSCCNPSAIFSPDHAMSIYVLLGCCMLAFVISALKEKVLAPLIEVIVNCMLLISLPLNYFIQQQYGVDEVSVLFFISVYIYMTYALVKNHVCFKSSGKISSESGFARVAWNILNKKEILKFPLLFLLCFPLLFVLVMFLLLFGQKPDSIIRAFTDTYYHEYSQWNHQCKNVTCPQGGHFLCTIGAKGDKKLVKPIRAGVRAGRPIACTRQLLISNAFEELLEKQVKWFHRPLRIFYNKVGAFTRKKDVLFDNKFVCNTVYLLMKPLEYFFLIVLYCVYGNPENHISVQYLSVKDREFIKKIYGDDTI